MAKPHDPTDLQAAEDERQAAEEREKRAYALLVSDLKWTMSTKQGRRHMDRLLRGAGVWEDSFNTNALQMARMAGARQVGLEWFNLILKHCSASYEMMLKERSENA